jgi:ATP-binding cassette subfamily A (ABC1) protein 3
MKIVFRPRVFSILCYKSFLLNMQSAWVLILNITLLFGVAVAVWYIGRLHLDKNFQPEGYYQVLTGYILMILVNSWQGRSLAMNLIRDRSIKFRFAMRNFGVTLFEYYVSNYGYNFLFCFVQQLIFLFFTAIIVPMAPFIVDSEVLATFFISTVLFLLAYSSLCCALSSMISKYNNASDLIGLITILINFIPSLIFLMVSRKNYADKTEDPTRDLNLFDGLYNFRWEYIAMPNMLYMQIMLVSSNEYFYRVCRTDLVNTVSTNAWPLAYGLALQFVGYTCLYLFIDYFFASDTGIPQVKLFKSKVRYTEHRTNDGPIRAPNSPLASKRETAGSNSRITLSLQDVVKIYPNGFKAVKGITGDIHSNQVTTILGHNGAGKSTLINILTCYDHPSEGAVYLDGLDIHADDALVLGQIGYASANDPLYEELSVYEFLKLIAMLKGVAYPDDHVMKLLRFCNLANYADREINRLSGGTRRRVSVAMAFIGEPKMIFLDEPSTGVDPENRRALWESINRLKSKDRIILMTTHHLEEAEFLSEDLIVMAKGEVINRGSPESLRVKFGLGYNITVRGLMDTQRKNSVMGYLNTISSDVTLDTESMNKGSLGVQFHLNTNSICMDFIRYLEKENIDFILGSHTLEQAYLNIDDSAKKHAQDFQDKIQKTYALMKKVSNSTLLGKIACLFLRKFMIIGQNGLQKLIIVMAVFIPASMTYFWLSFNYSVSHLKRVYPNEIYILSLMIIVYYFFGFSFFGMLPLNERLGRIRYLLKMNGINSFHYYLTMFTADALISWIIIYCSFQMVVDTSYKFMMIDGGKDSQATFSTWVWSLSFITQSYSISYIFQSKNAAAKSMTIILFMMNALYIVVSGYWLDTDSAWVSYTLDVIFTAKSNYTRFQDEVSGEDNLPNTNVYSGLISTVIFFALAIFLDWYHFGVQNTGTEFITGPLLNDKREIYDPQSVEAEENAAMGSNPSCVKLQGVYKRFGFFQALTNVNLVLRENEVLGLLGPNGAGKSTTFNIMSDYFSASHGKVQYFEKPIDQNQGIFSQVGLCAQDDILWFDLTVDQHLLLYRLLKGIDRVTTEHWKSLMDLEEFGETAAIGLSTGMKRKLCYIISMASNPKLKFLDEPTSGLDPVSRNIMKSLIKAQRDTFGGSAVFTTHTMEDAESMCDRIAILVNGKVNCIRSVSELKGLSGGLNISFLKQPDHPDPIREREELMQLFAKNFPNTLNPSAPVHILDDNIRKIVFDLRMDGYKVSSVFSTLESMKSMDLINDYQLSHKSLEDLFLELAQRQTPQTN